MGTASCLLIGILTVITCLFILALVDVIPNPMPYLSSLLSPAASAASSVAAAATTSPMTTKRSNFYSTRSGPDMGLPRRPFNEQVERQNQLNSDLSRVKLATDNLDDEQIEAYDPARLSLEKSVFDSHREFIEDAYVSTQGANSTDSVRSDEQHVNPRVGLRKVDYTSVFSEADSRVVSSESPDQIAQQTGEFVI